MTEILLTLILAEVARASRVTPAASPDESSLVPAALALIEARCLGAEARRRLVDTDECVDIIAERVGYADPRSFARSFRREHGVAPGAFRRASRAPSAS